LHFELLKHGNPRPRFNAEIYLSVRFSNLLRIGHDFSAAVAGQLISFFLKEREMQSGLNFEEEVAQLLKGAGIRYEREPTVNGLSLISSCQLVKNHFLS
jgi:hypothetical protein